LVTSSSVLFTANGTLSSAMFTTLFAFAAGVTFPAGATLAASVGTGVTVVKVAIVAVSAAAPGAPGVCAS